MGTEVLSNLPEGTQKVMELGSHRGSQALGSGFSSVLHRQVEAFLALKENRVNSNPRMLDRLRWRI